MNFTSPEFLLFFPIVLILYRHLPGRFRWVILLAASYLFYMNGDLRLGLLLLSSTAVSYAAAAGIARAKSTGAKRLWLCIALVFCLGCLFLFKSGQYLVVGISFYTFQTLSYVLDVYMGRTACEKHFGCYALFVSFFPQLVAGPIERKDDLLPQLRETRGADRQDEAVGGLLLLRGFFKKLVIADYLAPFVSAVYGSPGEAGALGAVLGTVFFAVQIYCDFSGYTDIARGTARFLGIRLMENFDHPYRAANVRDFWRRWHISLTRWFTDYVYIPHGGNRKGKVRTACNVMAVFLLSGLWHGLSLHYVAWGAFHGFWMVIDGAVRRRKCEAEGKASRKRPGCGIGRRLAQVATFCVVCVSWVFFRAQTLSDAFALFGQLATPFAGPGMSGTLERMQFGTVDFVRLPLVLVCFFLVEHLPDEPASGLAEGPSGNPASVRAAWQREDRLLTAFFMVIAIALSWLSELAQGGENIFLYFRF
jgi:D-alanyl-lipoteichoic acid acyltransferase DltB (MBOAT superfamily)